MVFSAVLVVALLPLLCCPLLHLLAHGARRGVGHALCAVFADTLGLMQAIRFSQSPRISPHPLHRGACLAGKHRFPPHGCVAHDGAHSAKAGGL